MNSSGSSVTSLVPGGVVTTQNISTVIRPKENNESMKFVKIHETELSRNAAEQIRVAEERKISKSKIKEEDEAWQENLRGWREQRRQQFGGTLSQDDDEHNNNEQENGRKIKTFAQMLEERAKAGNSLNYHLQRYIGSDDSEHSLENESEDSAITKNVNKKNDIDHSNLIHDLKLQDQKDVLATKQHSERKEINETRRNFPPTSVQQRNQSATSYNSLEDDERCDKFDEEKLVGGHNNNNSAEFDDFDELAQKPINSTFKQGIEKPPTPSTLHSTDRIKPMLDIEIQPNGRLVQPDRMDDEESETDEEEQEWKEEQKHQQRVAFVAKLKAFEQMTQPAVREPKFVPTRPSRQPPKPPRLIQTEIEVKSEPTQPAQPQSQPQPKAQKQQSQELPKQLEQIVPRQQRQSPQHHSPRQQPQLSPRLTAEAQPQLYPTDEPEHQSRLQPRQELLPQPQYSPPLPPAKVDKVPERILPTHQLQPAAPRHHVQPRQPRSQPNPPNMSRQTAHSHQTSQAPLKEDKAQDRTVLSVSGKKRCSSCKEELGRGAAAFVIESLNLVYHTNCFRCSVCHVNLSNGFRGVDVRVHAGALHCQNCYSKDGLNYSRV